MWIRSQDKKTLENVRLLRVEKNILYELVNVDDREKREPTGWRITTEYGNVIGEYKTEERTMEVLDEIHEYKESIETERLYASWTDASYYESHPAYSVYRMPEE